MRNLFGIAVLGTGGLVATVLWGSGWVGDLVDGRSTVAAAGSPATGKPGAPFAVVELFTSQGCSSCPSADRNLSRIVADAERRGLNVLALSFHVDYWNRLGWKDPYSDAAWTDRQSVYAKAFEADGLYTPQMVINGSHQFVGSDVKQSEAVIAESLAEPATGVALKISASTREQGGLRVDYELKDARVGESLVVALVRDSATKDVSRGENAGRKLSHRNVVRSLERVSAPGTRGTVNIKPPADFADATHRLIAFVQNTDTLEIRAAATVDIQQ